MALPTPQRLEWAAPSGMIVRLDEDGIAITWRSGGGIEEPEIEALLAAIAAAREAKIGPLAPLRPTREELRDGSYSDMRAGIVADTIRLLRDNA
jgi:hypothetical protein